MSDQQEKSGFWRKPRNKWLFGIPLGGFVFFGLGALAIMFFNGAMHYTSTNEFCYGCHVGMDTIVEEYEASPHFYNRTGVKVTCADCHIPREFFPKLMVKIRATADVWHKLTGKITPENFEQHRFRQAQHVWDELRATGSRECLNCHAFERMDTTVQGRSTPRRHMPERVGDKTCIDCHIGTAHKEPIAPPAEG